MTFRHSQLCIGTITHQDYQYYAQELLGARAKKNSKDIFFQNKIIDFESAKRYKNRKCINKLSYKYSIERLSAIQYDHQCHKN